MPAPPRCTLLLTRPVEDSARFAAMLPEYEAVIAPLLRIVSVPHDADRVQCAPALVLTSAHAVAAAGAGGGRLALCVGARTAEAASAAGFDVQQGSGDAQGLVPLIAACGLPLLHPHGRHVAADLGVPGMVVYDQQPRPLTRQAQALLCSGGNVVLPLFSARSAHLARRAVSAAQRRAGDDLRARLWVVAISPAVADTWQAATAGKAACADRLAIAARPTARAMASAIRRLCVAEQS